MIAMRSHMTLESIDLAALETVSGGVNKKYVAGFARSFKDAASWCPPANSPAGWSCRLAAGRGGGMAATDNGRWIRQ